MQSNGSDLQNMGRLAIDKLATYLDASQAADSHVVDLPPLDSIADALQIRRFLKYGGMDQGAFSSFLDTYLDHSMHMHHPGYIGHQVSLPHMGSMMADLIHGVANNPMSIFEMGPSAATIEFELIQWMLSKVGWTEGGGVFTHGGSVANIHAMLAARSAVAPGSWRDGNPPDLVILAPENSHYSIARAISILGLGQTSIIAIPTDQQEVVRPDALHQLIEKVRRNGHIIMAVVANACATATGLYDPIQEMGICCNQQECWLHLDSPHGATALLSEKYRHLMRGSELANSMIWDAHKMMQTSTLCTAVLFKDKASFKQTFQQEGSYLFYEKENQGVDSLPYQIECTKAPLATKLFLTLAIIGEKGMGQFVADLYDKAQCFARIIAERPGFSIDLPIESNIICFRYRPGQVDQLALREMLVRQGKHYISSTEVNGTRHLRIVVMNPLTDENIIEGLLDDISAIAL